MNKKTIRGYVYGVFPVDISIETGETSSVDDHWSWNYFEWIFYFLRAGIDFISSFLGTDAIFPIRIKEEDFLNMTEEEQRSLQEKMTGF